MMFDSSSVNPSSLIVNGAAARSNEFSSSAVSGLTLDFTEFHDVRARDMSPHTETWDDILFKIVDQPHEASTKSDLPLIKLAVFGDAKTDHGALRHNGNVQAVTGVEIDYDGALDCHGEKVSADAAAARLREAGIRAVVYTTPSNTPDAPRWRALVPFSRPLDPSEHWDMVAITNGILGGIAAPESFVLSQAYYVGKLKGDAGYRAVAVDGDCLNDVSERFADQKIGRPDRATPTVLHVAAGTGEPAAVAPSVPVDSVLQADIQSALEAITAYDDREAWLSVGMSMHSLGWGATGFRLWDTWAQQSAKHDPADSLRVWNSFRDNRGLGNATIRTLFYRAESQYGWTNPARERGQRAAHQQAATVPAAGVAQAPAAIVRRTPMDWAALAGRTPPEREWLTRGWLPYAPTLFVGAGGIGKTLLALEIGVALAIGRRFIDDVRAPARVLIWACEDDRDEIWRRVAAICRWFGIDMADLQGKLIVEPRIGEDNILLTTEYGKPLWTPLVGELADQIHDYDVDVLFLDNIGQTFAANENNRHDATAFLNGISGIGRGRKFAPVVMGHPARAAGSEFAGNAAWENAARMRWYLGTKLPGGRDPDDRDDGDADSSERFLCKRKTNYSEKDYVRLIYTDGVLVPDAPVSTGLEGTMKAAREKQARRVVLDGFRKLFATGQFPTATTNSPSYLPRMLLEARLNEGLPRLALKSALSDLMLDGALQMGTVSKYGNRNPRQGLLEANDACTK